MLFYLYHTAPAPNQAHVQHPDPPSEPPVEHDPQDGAQAEAEAEGEQFLVLMAVT